MGFRTSAILVEPGFPGEGAELLATFGVLARPTGSDPLPDAWHPAHLSVGRLGRCTLLLDQLLVELLLQRAPAAEAAIARALADHRVLALQIDEQARSWGWALWVRGQRVRARIGNARDGTLVDEGAQLPEERRWAPLLRPNGLHYVDPAGRLHSPAAQAIECARWLSAALLGAPLDRHPDLAETRVERFLELGADSEHAAGEPVVAMQRDALPVWLRRLLER